MAQLDVDEKRGSDPEKENTSRKKNSGLWIIAVVVILTIIVAWIALSDGKADVEIPPEPVVLKDRTGTQHLM